MSPGRLFCFGLGYSARVLARRLAEAGWTIAGTCRSAAHQAELAAIGITAHRFDGSAPLDPHVFSGTTHLLVSIPPDGEGDPALRHHAGTLGALPGLRWAGYLSTTGVYGDRGGAWIDETAEPRPRDAASQARLDAEQGWIAALPAPVQIFRLSAIYGPGRSAIDQLRAGIARRIVKPGQVFNRIHVADIATVLIASMARPRAGAVYNLADDAPAPAEEVVTHAASLLGIAPPPEQAYDESALPPRVVAFYRESRRIRNDRIKAELGVTLAYPTYREGLRAQIEAGR